MKNEKASNKALKHIVCCIIIIITFLITFKRVNALENVSVNNTEQESVLPLTPQLDNTLLELKRINIGESNNVVYDKPRVIKKGTNYYIKKHEKELMFFADMFGYNIDSIKQDIKSRNKGIVCNENNIANLLDENGNQNTYSSPLYGIVEYFYYLTNSNELERNKKMVPYEGDASYVEKLIIYYTTIYDNVDPSVALSIGAAESGYYTVKYMLKMNNVYGGMGYNGLIRHDNIELGVLNYIRMLSLNYYGKGINTISGIGYVYCPTRNDAGVKIASPHWINLVTRAKQKYDSYSYDVKINDIINY